MHPPTNSIWLDVLQAYTGPLSLEKGKVALCTSFPSTDEWSSSKRKMAQFHNLRLPTKCQHSRLRWSLWSYKHRVLWYECKGQEFIHIRWEIKKDYSDWWFRSRGGQGVCIHPEFTISILLYPALIKHPPHTGTWQHTKDMKVLESGCGPVFPLWRSMLKALFPFFEGNIREVTPAGLSVSINYFTAVHNRHCGISHMPAEKPKVIVAKTCKVQTTPVQWNLFSITPSSSKIKKISSLALWPHQYNVKSIYSNGK